jgi:hypothetical protein
MQNEQRSEIEQQSKTQVSETKKPWVPPVVSETPVSDATKSGLTGTGVDNGIYS